MIAPRSEVRTDPPSEYPTPHDPAAFRSWFEEEGFVVVRGAVATELCQSAVAAFHQEVLPDRAAWFERHASGTWERHVLTEEGFMRFPLMNLQDLSDRRYPTFKRRGLDLLTRPAVQAVVGTLFGEPGRVVHTMYFDGNQTTWAHRDGHYLDAQKAGGMVGVWVAAEDIHPDAGRFFVVPRSHRVPVPGEDANPNGTLYKDRMAEFVRTGPLDCLAPALRAGDLLVWNSLTIHGSLPTTASGHARRSFTAHYVPRSQPFHWKVSAHATSHAMAVNGVDVALHARGGSPLRRVRNALRSELPRVYGATRAMTTWFSARDG